MSLNGVSKMEMKRIIGVLVLLSLLVFPGFALGENPLGTTIYSVAYNQLPTTGTYYGEILRYSDLSTTDSTVLVYYIVEKVTAGGERGVLNATVSLQRTNGTTETSKYSYDYDPVFNPEPLSFFLRLDKGDNALVTVFNVSSNISSVQVVKNANAPRVTVLSVTWLDTFASGFAKVFEFESNLIDSLSTPAYVCFMLLEIIILPVLFVCLIAWAFRKVREAFLR